MLSGLVRAQHRDKLRHPVSLAHYRAAATGGEKSVRLFRRGFMMNAHRDTNYQMFVVDSLSRWWYLLKLLKAGWPTAQDNVRPKFPLNPACCRKTCLARRRENLPGSTDGKPCLTRRWGMWGGADGYGRDGDGCDVRHGRRLSAQG